MRQTGADFSRMLSIIGHPDYEEHTIIDNLWKVLSNYRSFVALADKNIKVMFSWFN